MFSLVGHANRSATNIIKEEHSKVWSSKCSDNLKRTHDVKKMTSKALENFPQRIYSLLTIK
jgi:hypothetical protein